MTTTTAAVTSALDADFRLQTLTLDEPRHDEVRVRMVAAGVCHTDAVVRDGWIPTTFPIVLGHEGAGIVEAVGSGIRHLAPGDHVVLTVASCGLCRECLGGHMAFCEDSYLQNFAGGRADGTTALAAEDGSAVRSHFFGQSSFAGAANVAARSVVKVRDDVPLELLAPLGCGVQTGAGTVLNVLRPRRASTLVVFGSGAVGMSALLAAVASGVERIVAVDVVDSRLELARSLGVTHTINGRTDDAATALAEISGGGVEYAIDTTGAPGVVELMLDALAYRGHAVLVAAARPDAMARLPLASALSRSIQISTVKEGDAIPQLFIPELIELYLRGEFPFDKLITHYPFEQISQAFADSESGAVVKPVLTFDA